MGDNWILLCGVVSCCNLPHMMCRAGSIIIDVKRPLMLYEEMHSSVASGWIWPVLQSAGYFYGGISTYQMSKDIGHFLSY